MLKLTYTLPLKGNALNPQILKDILSGEPVRRDAEKKCEVSFLNVDAYESVNKETKELVIRNRHMVATETMSIELTKAVFENSEQTIDASCENMEHDSISELGKVNGEMVYYYYNTAEKDIKFFTNNAFLKEIKLSVMVTPIDYLEFEFEDYYPIVNLPATENTDLPKIEYNNNGLGNIMEEQAAAIIRKEASSVSAAQFLTDMFGNVYLPVDYYCKTVGFFNNENPCRRNAQVEYRIDLIKIKDGTGTPDSIDLDIIGEIPDISPQGYGYEHGRGVIKQLAII